MNQQEILKKIGQIIQELNDQQQYLCKTSKINDLELELFIANADFLIDHIEVLKKLNGQNSIEETKQPEVNHIENKVFDEKIAEIIIVDELIEDVVVDTEKPLFDFSFEEKPSEMFFEFEKEPKTEAIFESEINNTDNEVLEVKTKLPEPEHSFIDEEEDGPEPYIITVKEKEETVISVIEKVQIIEEEVKEEILTVTVKSTVKEESEGTMTLNELLSSRLERRNTPLSFPKKESSDLKIAISLNDKMIFIKELFNGYNLAYSEAIEILNRFESFEAADNFLLKNYAQKNTWATKQDIVDRFYEYINKKFSF